MRHPWEYPEATGKPPRTRECPVCGATGRRNGYQGAWFTRMPGAEHEVSPAPPCPGIGVVKAPRPLILLDVDGVINAPQAPVSKLVRDYWGYQCCVSFDPWTGRLLLDLAAETGGELAWATMWEDRANEVISPLLGLPRLPFCPVSEGALGKSNGYPLKAASIVPWTNGRPFVWFEDEPEEIAEVSVRAQGQLHLPVMVDEWTGLTADHIAMAREWLLALRNRTEAAEAAARLFED